MLYLKVGLEHRVSGVELRVEGWEELSGGHLWWLSLDDGSSWGPGFPGLQLAWGGGLGSRGQLWSRHFPLPRSWSGGWGPRGQSQPPAVLPSTSLQLVQSPATARLQFPAMASPWDGGLFLGAPMCQHCPTGLHSHLPWVRSRAPLHALELRQLPSHTQPSSPGLSLLCLLWPE